MLTERCGPLTGLPQLVASAFKSRTQAALSCSSSQRSSDSIARRCVMAEIYLGFLMRGRLAIIRRRAASLLVERALV